MAIISISKIQVRRGLQENLPQLTGAEFGWSVDERRLFIGNGTLTEGAPVIGNTEILTADSDFISIARAYTFKGTEAGYTSQTSTSPASPVARSIGEKLDEIISFRDFIEDADVTGGDYTVALQRAIDQIYPAVLFTTDSLRRTLKIPAGTYTISGVILIPPYCTIIGDGSESTIIRQTDVVSDSIFKLADSLKQVDSELGNNGATLPTHVTIEGITLDNQTDNDIIVIDSANEILFNDVKFVGSLTTPVTTGNFKSAASIASTSGQTYNVHFENCEFSDITRGVYAIGDVINTTITKSNFDTLYQSVVAEVNSGNSPQGLKVTYSKFGNISAHAILSSDLSSVISAFNNYEATIGYTDGAAIVTATVAYSVLSYETANNNSIGDMFVRSDADIASQPLIEVTDQTTATTANVSVNTTTGTLQSSTGKSETLTDNTSGNASVVLSSSLTNIIDYSIVRGANTRTGTIHTSNTSTTLHFMDDYVESADVGVTLDFTGTNKAAVMSYVVTSTGNNAILRYNVRSFI